MKSNPSFYLLVIVIWLVHPILAIGTDVVQLNLVFPLNNTVYKPVFPFPIVFSVQNAARIWSYHPMFRWQLSRQWEDELSEPIFSTGGFDHGSDNKSAFYMGDKLPPERFFLIRGNKAIVNANLPLKLRLDYSFSISPNCSVVRRNGTQLEPEETILYTAQGTVLFDLNWNGTQPNVLANGTCSTPLDTLGVSGSPLNENNRTCPKVITPAPAPDPCGLKIDDDTVYRVEKAMIRQSNCDMKNWPDPKFNGTCQRSSATHMYTASRWQVLVQLVVFAFLSTLIGFF